MSESYPGKECELLFEALNRELTTVKNQLAVLTLNLDVKIEVPSLPLHHHHHTPTPPHSSLHPIDHSLHRPPSLLPPPLHQIDSSPSPPHRTSSTTRHKPKKKERSTCTSPALAEVSRLLQVVDDRDKERRKTKKRYLTLMREHIETQLKELTEKESQFKKKKEKRKKKERTARLQLKPVRYRSNGADDKKYLSNLHKSSYYQIVNMEHVLKKTGKLKTASELEYFWDTMLSPLKDELEDEEEDGEGEEEEEDDGRVECANSWAITALPSKVQIECPPSTCSDSTATDIKFIPHKMPEMIPIRDILDGEKDNRILELQTSPHCLQDTARYHKELRTQTFTVYQRARANEIAMRSLLPRIQSMERPCFTLGSSPLPSIPQPETPHERGHDLARKLPCRDLARKIPCTGEDLARNSKLPCTEGEDHSRSVVRSNSLPQNGRIKKTKHVGEHCPVVTTESGLKRSTLLPSIGIVESSSAAAQPIAVSLTMTDLLKTSPTVKEISKKTTSWSNYLVTAGTS